MPPPKLPPGATLVEEDEIKLPAGATRVDAVQSKPESTFQGNPMRNRRQEINRAAGVKVTPREVEQERNSANPQFNDPELQGLHPGKMAVRGILQVGSGLQQMGRGDIAGGLSNTIRGTGTYVAPFSGPLILNNPIGAAGAVVGGEIGSNAAGWAAKELGAPENYVELAKDAGGIVGGGLGDAAATAITPKLGRAGEMFANYWMRKALSPSKSNAPTPADIRQSAQTMLEENIPLNESGMSKLDSLKRDTWAQLNQVVSNAANQGRRILPEDIAAAVQSIKQRFGKDFAGSADEKAIDSVVSEFLKNNGVRPPTPPQPTGLVGPNGQPLMTAGTPATTGTPMNPVDVLESKAITSQNLGNKAFGELKGAEVEARKALIRGAKQQLEQLSPEIRALNQRYGNLAELDPILEDAVRRGYVRHAGLNDTATVTGGAVVGGGAGAATGMGLRFLANPKSQAKIAHLIYRGAKLVGQPLNWKESLARAAAIAESMQSEEPQETQE